MEAALETNLNVGNVFAVGPLKFWALGDRVLIEEDEFKSGYECDSCGGSGKAVCTACNGTTMLNGTFKCHHCTGGNTACAECGGKGGLLVAPEISQRRPTTGKIVSLGDECKALKLGQQVMYSNFAGYVVDLSRGGRKVSIRILHEPEVLCGMEGQLDARGLRGKTEIAEFGASHT